MVTAAPVVTLLYVPGDRPDRVRKALDSAADVVIVDLEDAVAPSAKVAAREVLATVTAEDAVRVQVRVNAVGTPWHDQDLEAVRGMPPLAGVRVPKCRSVDDVLGVAGQVPGVALHLLLEDALGVERAFDLASAHEQVASLGLGEADLRSALGVTVEEGLTWCRSRVVVAASAAGLAPPQMSAWTELGDLDGLAASCRLGRGLGFVGRTAIHPSQLPVIERAFAPAPEEVARAREVVARVAGAAEAGAGTVVLPDGGFVDVAMIQAAERTIALGERSQQGQHRRTHGSPAAWPRPTPTDS